MSEMKNILTEWRKFRNVASRKRLTEQARRDLERRAAAAFGEMDADFAAEEPKESEEAEEGYRPVQQAKLATTDVKQALRQALKAEPTVPMSDDEAQAEFDVITAEEDWEHPVDDEEEEFDTSLEDAFQLGQPDVEDALRGEPTWGELHDEFDAIEGEEEYDWLTSDDDEEEDPDDRIKRMLRDLTGRDSP